MKSSIMKCFKYDKKGVIEIQFNWIFIGIAGAVFLFLFLSIINSQKSQSDKSVNYELLQKLDSLILGSASSYESFKTVSLPSVDMSVICDSDGYSALEIGKGIARATPSQAIYSRPKINTKTLSIFTDVYSAGFPVAPIIYLTSPTIRYVFVNDSSDDGSKALGDLYSHFPENTTEFLADPSMVNSLTEKSDETVLVSFGRRIEYLPSALSAKKTFGVVFNIGSSGQGGLEFCNYISGTAVCATEIYYSGYPMLKGAVISADATSYVCNSLKILKRQSMLTTLYLNRTQLIINTSRLARDCNNTYASISPQLDLLLNFNDPRSSDNMRGIAEVSKILSMLNDDLIRGTRCPLLY
jgi:hypothetical protein